MAKNTHKYYKTKARRGDAWITTINTSEPAPHAGYEELEGVYDENGYIPPEITISISKLKGTK